MLVIKTKRYIKKHVVGGAGVFSTLSSFLKRLITSNAVKSLASEVGKSALSAGKELATSVISTAKDAAIEKLVSPKSKPVITQKSKDILASLVNGRGHAAVRIEDLVKEHRGTGLRLTTH